MSREAHLTDVQLVDLVEGRVSAAERSTVDLHLSRCASCNREATAFRRLIDLMQTDRSPDAPEYVLNRAFRLLRTHRLATSEAAPPRRKLSALLRRDSFQPGFGLAVRGAPVPIRQLLFEIGDENELEVRIEQAEGGWRVAGQILGTCQGGQVILEGVAGRATADLNALCEFALPPHPGPIYKLVLQLQDVEVDVPILELRG